MRKYSASLARVLFQGQWEGSAREHHQHMDWRILAKTKHNNAQSVHLHFPYCRLELKQKSKQEDSICVKGFDLAGHSGASVAKLFLKIEILKKAVICLQTYSYNVT